MKCTDCPYYWQERWEDFPSCQFDPVYHPTPSPCEYEDMYVEDEYDYDYDEERW